MGEREQRPRGGSQRSTKVIEMVCIPVVRTMVLREVAMVECWSGGVRVDEGRASRDC